MQGALVEAMPMAALSGASFNEDASCFAIAYANGFRVFNSDPMEAWVVRDFGDGGLALASMLKRTNYLALVGGGSTPKFPQNKVVIWDDLKQSATLSLEFVLPVLNVLLSRTRIVVVLANKVHVYTFSAQPRLLGTLETAENPGGAAALNGDTLAVPALAPGRVQLVQLGDTVRVAHILRAHKTAVRQLALTGGYLATASARGTIVRVFSLATLGEHCQFRRGLDAAIIYSMAFSPSNELAVLSDKHTLHVYEIEGAGNRRHMLRKSPVASQYFGSQWSYVSCTVGQKGPGVCAWTGNDVLIVLWKESARWEKYVVLRDSNELVLEAWRRLLT